MLQIPRRVEYALKAVLALARAGDSGRLSFKDIADREDIPRDYLAKILRCLVDANVVVSRRGANGGFSLARPADEISFLEVIEAADSPVALNLCTPHGAGCSHSNDCVMASVWNAAESAVRHVFAQTSVGQMLRRPLELQPPVPGPVADDRPCARI